MDAEQLREALLEHGCDEGCGKGPYIVHDIELPYIAARLSRLEAGGGGEARELLRQALNVLGCADKPDPFEKLIGSDLTVWEAMRLESERLWDAYRALSPSVED
jgi:hypothetical protein